ncbi:outer membrane protein [Bartonella sp. CB189]|uniref:outer membrane protein n=1 Tax=Bartonella sp. CB189 TaxID=3112254 RepID=UPI002F961E19
MSTKYLMVASVFSIISFSVAKAADVKIPYKTDTKAYYKSEPVLSSVANSSDFSWAGFYFGGQIGTFSSKISATSRYGYVPTFSNERGVVGEEGEGESKKWVPVEKKYLPELSGFIGGFFAGANVDFGNSIILGVDTDVLLSERKNTKTVSLSLMDSEENGGEGNRGVEKDIITFKHTLKQKWTGATRVRVGFSTCCVMPYISGGVAYGHFKDILSLSFTGVETFDTKLDDEQTMIGYTLGGGLDFAITDNVIARAEYRYSDFGRKKFGKEIELDYKTNDFRVGVAYKF